MSAGSEILKTQCTSFPPTSETAGYVSSGLSLELCQLSELGRGFSAGVQRVPPLEKARLRTETPDYRTHRTRCVGHTVRCGDHGHSDNLDTEKENHEC